ncbi:MAG: Calx-beta domain-containing protein [Mycobacterium sp.]
MLLPNVIGVIMSSRSIALNVRVGSAAFAVGVGLAVATNSGAALADTSKSGGASQSPDSGPSSEAGSKRAGSAATRASGPAGAAKPASANKDSAQSARAESSPARAPETSARRGSSAAITDTSTNTAARERVRSKPSVSRALVSQQPTSTAAAATARPAEDLSGTSRQSRRASGADNGVPAAPVELVTAGLALARREIEKTSYSSQVDVPLQTAPTMFATGTSMTYGAAPTRALPAASIANASGNESNSGTANLGFAVTLTKPSKVAVTVRYTTSNGTATAGQDYTAASGILTFAPGVTSQVANIGVLGDATVESNETFTVTLSGPSGMTVASGTATGTIVNDDAVAGLPTVSIASGSRNESNSGTANLGFTVTLSSPSSTAVTVRYATSNGTATAGQDYTAASGTLTFAPGVTSQVANIGVLGDATVESNETFTVTLSGASGATVAAGTATGTIVNDDTTAPPSDPWGNAFFAPYVAMENYPTPNLQALANASGADKMVIGFIQADSTGKAAWGGYSLLQPGSSNAQAKAINTSIAQFQAAGGDAMISFGGAVGTSLWEHYSNNGLGAQALANTYASIADTYGVDHLDFDIEAGGVSNRTAVDLNSQALKLLQQARPNLTVWYTLGAGPSGLYTNSVYAVESGLKAGVKVDGVNIMAMDFGEAAAPTSGPNAQTMGTWAIRSAQSTYNQMTALYSKYGKTFGWKNLGVTPMIGVNDVRTEIFTVADAQALEDFARSKGIGMLSMWSLLRDNPGNVGQVTGNTSGTNAAVNSYSKVYDDYGVINT